MASRARASIPITEFMNPVPGTVSEDASVREAANKMVDLYVPVLPVVDGGGRLCGLLAQMEIVWVLAEDKDASTMPVRDIMRPEEGASIDLPIEELAAKVLEAHAHNLFLVDDGRPLGFVTADELEARAAVERALGPTAAELVTEISPGDEMFTGWRGAYYKAAVSALDCIRDSLRAGGRANVESILDLPCGHGRVLRMLQAAFPEALLAACDIDRGGVDFCARAFDAEPIYSHEDPAEVPLARSFDLAWCGSLFTHLSPERWSDFLHLFERALAPGGVLVFTTLDRVEGRLIEEIGLSGDLAQSLLRQYDQAGFAYVETVRAGYGLTLSSSDWVRAQIDALPGLDLVRAAQQAWPSPVPRHDVFTCVRR